MKNQIHCPNCGSRKVYSTDNEPLAHGEADRVLFGDSFDNELYMFFHCKECEKEFKLTMEVVPPKQEPFRGQWLVTVEKTVREDIFVTTYNSDSAKILALEMAKKDGSNYIVVDCKFDTIV